jgi:hypothetical protein
MKTAAAKCVWIGAVCAMGALLGISLAAQQAKPQKPSAQPRAAASDQLRIRADTTLPSTYPHARYLVYLDQLYLESWGNAVPPLHWKVVSGALPPGITLDDVGLLHGEPLRTGEYHFVISVTDNGKPQQAVQKEFVLKVEEAMTVVWKTLCGVSVRNELVTVVFLPPAPATVARTV